MAQVAITLPRIIVDNLSVLIMPGTFEYDEGLGETTVEAQSAGGGAFENVISDDGTTHLSEFTFSIRNTIPLIELARSWKVVRLHAVQLVDVGFTRTFNNAVLTNVYKVGTGIDSVLELIWMSDPVV